MSNKIRTKVTLIGTVVLFLSMWFVPAAAQTRQQPKLQPPTQSGGEPTGAPAILVSPDEDYRIGARDVIEIRVDDAPELSVTTSVNADGTFLMPYLKRVKALSKTPEELSREIADGLRGRYLKDPNVIVLVKQFYSRSFFILGAVKKPGVYQIEGKPQLLRLITLAGGPAETHGTVAYIIREIKKTPPSDPGTAKPVANSNQTPATANNDGASAEEPEYDIKMVNINGMFKGLGLGGRDSYLEPGDIVNIPQADVFYVAGEVNAPGSFPLSEGTTLRQAIALSQGTTMNAALGSGVIFRQDASTGKRVEIPVNIGEVMKAKKEDIPLLANDIVIVPNSRSKTIGNSILKAVGMGAAQRGVVY
ncbi:MAG TPA: polysaccharide biosynthesis/export family protein [Blastocatellia bacterium]|nr:polysaccharide biosynthesis/export family protein [Blastocatellia bacterium]